MTSSLPASEGAWPTQGRVGVMTQGRMAGPHVLVWRDKDPGLWWMATERPEPEGYELWTGTVAALRARIDSAGVQWIADGPDEARTEARVFGLQPVMTGGGSEPCQAGPTVEGARHSSGPAQTWTGRVSSPGARWLAFPFAFAVTAAAAVGAWQAFTSDQWPVWLAWLLFIVSVFHLFVAVRSWSLRIDFEADRVVIHSWVRSRSIERSRVVGATSAEYTGEVPFTVSWAFVERHLTALSFVCDPPPPVVVGEIFGSPRTMTKLAAKLDSLVKPPEDDASTREM